jgi:hypothetical protein
MFASQLVPAPGLAIGAEASVARIRGSIPDDGELPFTIPVEDLVARLSTLHPGLVRDRVSDTVVIDEFADQHRWGRLLCIRLGQNPERAQQG